MTGHELQVTNTEIESWFSRYPNAKNTGVLTRTTPAVDIDVYDGEVADELEALLWELIGTRGMVRFGHPPKRACLFRTDQPFGKRSTPDFISPNQRHHHVEVLCDGQQLIVYGTHPDTGRDYSWYGGELDKIMRADLPELSQAVASEFIDKATALMREQGWIEHARKPNGNGADHGAATGNEFDAFYGEREQKFAQAALQGLAAELAAMAPESGRNNRLNKSAFRLGTMIARNWLLRADVEARLLAACHANRLVRDTGQRAVEKTIASGIEAGIERPHEDSKDRSFAQQLDNTGAEIQIVCASAVKQQPVLWLWKNRLARGKITLLGGDPGLGKSQIIVDIIARISAGLPWPDGGVAPRGFCIILSAEDAASDVICPRLELAGADLSRVAIVQSVREKDGRRRSFNLQRDLDILSNEVAKIGNVVLIGIDPVTAYLGDKIDSHRTTDVRAIMERLDKFGEDTGISVLAVTHPPKQAQGKAINSFTGSLAFAAASRLCFIAVEETDTDRLLMLAVKNNIGGKAEGIGYRLKTGSTVQGIESCCIDWDLAPVIVSANEALAEAASEPKRGAQRREAEEFLVGYLEAGPMPVEKVEAAAKANGIAGRTLRRAREGLHVVVEKSGLHRGMAMAPAMMPKVAKMATSTCEDGHVFFKWPSSFNLEGHLRGFSRRWPHQNRWPSSKVARSKRRGQLGGPRKIDPDPGFYWRLGVMNGFLLAPQPAGRFRAEKAVLGPPLNAPFWADVAPTRR